MVPAGLPLRIVTSYAGPCPSTSAVTLVLLAVFGSAGTSCRGPAPVVNEDSAKGPGASAASEHLNPYCAFGSSSASGRNTSNSYAGALICVCVPLTSAPRASVSCTRDESLATGGVH